MPAMRRRGVAVACVSSLVSGRAPRRSVSAAPARVIGHGTARSCTSSAVVAAVRAGEGSGSRAVQARHDPDGRDGQGPQLAPRGRPRWGRIGHAERRGPAAHPLHGHLRPRSDVHDVALPGPGHAAAGRREPRLRGRELQRPGLRRRRRRRDLRARRASEHRELHLCPESLRAKRARHRRRSGARAVRISRPSRGGRRQSLHGQRLQQRWCAEQHRGVVERGAQPVRRQPSDRARRQPISTRHAGRRQRRGDLQRRKPLHADGHR